MLTFVITDTHGSADQLLEQLASIKKYANKEYKIIHLGDAIDRGPKSKECIDILIDLKANRPQDVFLKGNHEDMLLEGKDYWLFNGGFQTLISYNYDKSPNYFDDTEDYDFLQFLPQSHAEFLNDLKLYHTDEQRIYVHAGINPKKSFEDNTKEDLVWIRDEFLYWNGPFSQKATLGGKYIIHGHTPKRKPEITEFRCNLDTGGVFGHSEKFTIGVFNDEQQKPIDIIQVDGLPRSWE
jgi:serine/threonine protein phosphatase 1